MDLKEKLISSFMAFEEQLDLSSSIHEMRTRSLKQFEEIGFPTKKEDCLLYTSPSPRDVEESRMPSSA